MQQPIHFLKERKKGRIDKKKSFSRAENLNKKPQCERNKDKLIQEKLYFDVY